MFEKLKIKGNITGDITVTVETPLKWTKCKRCKKSIIWAVTKNAKKMPITQDNDGDWVCHFANCEYASSFKKKNFSDIDEIKRQQLRDRMYNERR